MGGGGGGGGGGENDSLTHIYGSKSVTDRHCRQKVPEFIMRARPSTVKVPYSAHSLSSIERVQASSQYLYRSFKLKDTAFSKLGVHLQSCPRNG